MEELCLRATNGRKCCRSGLCSTFNYKHRSARVCSSRLLLTVGDTLRTMSAIKTGTQSVSSITGPNIASRQECQSKNLSLTPIISDISHLSLLSNMYLTLSHLSLLSHISHSHTSHYFHISPTLTPPTVLTLFCKATTELVSSVATTWTVT